MFSFGLVLWEMYARRRIYENLPSSDNIPTVWDEGQQMEVADVKVVPVWYASSGQRPNIPVFADRPCPTPLAMLIQACWTAEAAERPTFGQVKLAVAMAEAGMSLSMLTGVKGGGHWPGITWC